MSELYTAAMRHVERAVDNLRRELAKPRGVGEPFETVRAQQEKTLHIWEFLLEYLKRTAEQSTEDLIAKFAYTQSELEVQRKRDACLIADLKMELDIVKGRHLTVDFKRMVETLKNLRDNQCQEGTYDSNEYMRGMANGLILAVSVFDGTDPVFYDADVVKQSTAKDDSDGY